MTSAEKVAAIDRILNSSLLFEWKLSGIAMVLRAPTTFPLTRRPTARRALPGHGPGGSS
ncbi:hypothetical protein OG394_29120 [Kribbella sp. NBC_01245]|uniref:hypothetical protein n=1 Tax=Kribbella sp. NBC_01245 TaxID=2903578 RepID=UPI002E2978C0|nr:hypothetical protein [Kribbella sp. NBC_01245]